MRFDLKKARLGDFLLALPAMRPGDEAVIRPEFRLPGLDLVYLDEGSGLRPCGVPGAHVTDGWLKAARRLPRAWDLLPPIKKALTVIAPSVDDPGRQWGHWDELGKRLPHARWLGANEPRGEWMAILNQAHTVICPDTGTVHMADALGCPKVIGLYAKHFTTHAPYWNRAHCIDKRSMDEITVEDVMERANG